MKIQIDRNWRVCATGHVDLPLPAISVWGQMRDVERFLSMDPLHTGVRMERDEGTPAEGTFRGRRVVIPHRLMGVGPTRVGRILVWREQRGFAISDLSQRSVRVGFPHVCSYALQPMGKDCCRLVISARGRWTATWVPRPFVRAWLWWVMRATEGHIATEMAAFAAWRRQRRVVP